jgi:hypothetical protein
MDEFNLVVIKESLEEGTGREAKSALEEGRKHHNLSRFGCRNIFPSDSTPLQDDAVREEVIHNELVNFTFIRDGWLENMWVRGSHHRGERLQQHRIGANAKGEIARNGSGGRSD